MLKSLELFGFKSFADKTQFDFSTGITAVVGPNGSGKSNVVDGIKWILGDQSAKSLRGKEMTDVIFNGAAGRKSASYAEATLCFDNRSGFLPLEAQEVQIGRRLWRSGDSEYLINRQVARLKDIRELLMGTGAGASAYCIIEQGRVDQILQANATTRRLVFEEAAGISRYKARRTEAQRKLERVEQNLLRLTDIVDELDSQLAGLRSQATKAARFRELSERLRRVWIGLAADDYRTLSARRQQHEQVAGKLSERSEELQRRQQTLLQQLDQLDEELGTVEDGLRLAERRQAGEREAIVREESAVRHQSSRLRELATEIERLQQQDAAMRERAQESLAEEQHLRDVLDRHTSEHTAARRELNEAGAEYREESRRVEAERQRLEQLRQQMLEQMRQVSVATGHVSSLEAQQEGHFTRHETLDQHQRELQTRLEQAEAVCADSLRKLEQLRERYRDSLQQRRDMESSLSALRGEQGAFQKNLADLRETRSAWTARRAVLEDLESRQEGLGIGVKEILQRAQTPTASPWDTVLGSVADLLEVDLEHAALLEVALGSRAQLIVVRRMEPMIRYLQQATTRISARVGFVALERHGSLAESVPHDGTEGTPPHPVLRLDPQQVPALDGCVGVIARMDRLLNASETVPDLGARLLCDTWVVESLDQAQGLAQGAGRGCRFVTLQGELLEADGTLYAGSVRGESALVSRKSELRGLRADLTRLDAQIEEEEQRLSKISHSLTQVDSRLDTADSRLQRLQHAVNEQQSEYEEHRQATERLRHEQETLERQRETLRHQFEELSREIETARQAQQDADRTLQQLQATIADVEHSIVRRERRVQELDQVRIDQQQRLTKQEERLGSTRGALQRLQRDLQQRQREQQEAGRRLQAARTRHQELTRNLLNTRGRLAEHSYQEERLAETVGKLFGTRNRIRKRRSLLYDEESGLRSQRHEIDEQQHQAEIERRSLQHQLATMAERIRDEYQVELSAAVEQGASAWTIFREEGRFSESASESAREGAAAERGAMAADVSARTVGGDGEERASGVGAGADQDAVDFAAVRPQIEEEVSRLRRKLRNLGQVNSESLDSLDELEGRFTRLNTQLQDLVEARSALEEIIRRINAESRQLFRETFESIRANFRELFRKLFGGGEGDIILEDPEDILECGIDVVARPPGKELRSLSLLSGGEKTMTAVALLMAIFKSRPSPFCILDEVDAALDDANVDRFVNLLREFQESTQFIMITHRKPSMAVADVLYGVTMEQSGVSKRMSVRFEDISENGEFRPGASEGGDRTAAA